MHTLLIIFHITCMVASLALMSAAVVGGLFGKTIAARISSIGMSVTIVGTGAGALLLMSDPLKLQCVMLTAYLLGVSALYVFGFGAGIAEKARLIRTNS